MSYNKLDIYNIAFKLFIETHQLSLQLPKYEVYEHGSQLRRSAEFKEKSEQYNLLGGKINNFIKYVQLNWRT